METTTRDAVDLAMKIANVDSASPPDVVDTAARFGGRYEDIPRRIPDSTKAQRELGWRLQVDVEEGIRRTIDWARANPWYLGNPRVISRKRLMSLGPVVRLRNRDATAVDEQSAACQPLRARGRQAPRSTAPAIGSMRASGGSSYGRPGYCRR